MITSKDIDIAKHCISFATCNGADAVRVSMSTSTLDSVTMLNGVLDKVTHASDKSVYLYIYISPGFSSFHFSAKSE